MCHPRKSSPSSMWVIRVLSGAFFERLDGVRDPDHGGHLPGSPPTALALLRVPNSLLPRIVARLLSRWRLGRRRVRVDRDGAPLSLYVVSAADNQGILV